MSPDLDRAPGTSWPRRRWRPRPRLDWSLGLSLAVVWPVTGLLYDLHLRHAERIPPSGGVLLLAIHVSVLDPVA